VHTIHLPPLSFQWETSPTPISEVTDEFVVIGVKHRYRCKTCGTHIASWNEAKEKWSVWGATLDRDDDNKIVGWEWAKPTDHQFYGTRMLDIPDGLDKWDGYAHQSKAIDSPS
jgi:hypothetical protein